MTDLEKKRIAQFLARNSRKRAKRIGVEHTLKWNDIVIPDVCPVTLQPMQQHKIQMQGDSYTLDRLDPNKGYTKDNVWVLSWQANKAKADLTLEQLERLVNLIQQQLKLNQRMA